jgi:dTDP-glucose pyrophosphorylase
MFCGFFFALSKIGPNHFPHHVRRELGQSYPISLYDHQGVAYMDGISKAVIMARGLGTRMRKADESAALSPDQMSAASVGVKAMIPIGRPFLDYVISGLADAGYSEICLVIGPEHQMIRDYYFTQSPPKRVKVSFAVQEKPLGTADAVLAAREFTGKDSFLIINSDNYYPVETLRSLRNLKGAGVALFDRESLISLSNMPEDRVLKFSVAKVSSEGRLAHIYEKPSEDTIRELGSPIYVSMNSWLFTPVIHRACTSIQPSARGEMELTDAVQYAIDTLGEPFHVLTFKAPVLDMSSRSDIANVAEQLRNVHPNP